MPEKYETSHEREAFELGAAAGIAAASWVADGNTSAEHISRVLEMMDAGDPQVEDYLPAMPNLSGEWADAPTADAWEAGVASTFESECERILRAMAPDPEAPHVGHYSRIGGTYWCDTCNSPYCENA